MIYTHHYVNLPECLRADLQALLQKNFDLLYSLFCGVMRALPDEEVYLDLVQKRGSILILRREGHWWANLQLDEGKSFLIRAGYGNDSVFEDLNLPIYMKLFYDKGEWWCRADHRYDFTFPLFETLMWIEEELHRNEISRA